MYLLNYLIIFITFISSICLHASTCRSADPFSFVQSEGPIEIARSNEAYDNFVKFGVDAFGMPAFLTASRTFQVAEGPTITLVGVVHMGAEAYYESLQNCLADFDAVFFEQVLSDQELVVQNELVKTYEPCAKLERFDYVNIISAGLGLKRQVDSINLLSPNFFRLDSIRGIESAAGFDLSDEVSSKRRCDLLISEISNTTKEMLPAHILGAQDPLDLIVTTMKQRVGDRMSNAKDLIYSERSFKDTFGIIEERNAFVMERIRKLAASESREKNFAIFFGVVHMPGFQHDLMDLGYVPTQEEWFVAFSLLRE